MLCKFKVIIAIQLLFLYIKCTLAEENSNVVMRPYFLVQLHINPRVFSFFKWDLPREAVE